MAVPIVMPKLGMVMSEGTVAKWSKSAGQPVEQGEIIAEIETEKINYELEATEGGIFHPVVDEGAVVPVDGLLGYLLAEGEAPPEPPSPTPTPAVAAPAAVAPRRQAAPRTPGDVVPSTPGARRVAASLEADISLVTPTGPRGRVTEGDVRAYVEQQAAATVPPGLPTPSKTVPLAGIRKTIARHMRDSISSTAQLSYFLELDVTEAQRLRREVSKDADTAVNLAHVLIKACAEALKRVPSHNTVLAGDRVLYFDDINIGVAVALSDGLVVPVLRNVEKKDVFQISDETQELSEKAREGKLLPDDMAGGTFTISILGSVDGFTPILNTGQNAILGAGRTVQKPVVRDGEIVVREMMTVSLTADHQVIDGAVAASFMRRLQQQIERPAPLFRRAESTGG